MKASEIEIGNDYEVKRGYYGYRHRMRIIEKQEGGFWQARVMRDKYSEGKPGDLHLIESRQVIQPWAKLRAELEARNAIDREWNRAHGNAERQARSLVERLADFDAELGYIDIESDDAGLPDQPLLSIDLTLDGLQRLVGALEGAGEPEAEDSALLDLIRA